MNTIETANKYIAPTYKRYPIDIVYGKGALLTDSNGKKYIDMGSGIAVNIFGLQDSRWIDAVKEQLETVSHTSNYYYNDPSAKLAYLLCEKTGAKKVFFCNSGGEANECAIKAARRYAYLKKGEGHHTIITLKNSFHGRTITTLSATGQDSFHIPDFAPYTQGFITVDPDIPGDLERVATQNDCAAVIIEALRGEGGVLPLSKEFIHELEAVCKKFGLLLIADEVQCGLGRTGKFFGYMNYGLNPDIVTMAKGLAGGLPIGACLFFEKTADSLSYGLHGSTFGGNPVCCAGACSVVSRIDKRLFDEVLKKSLYIKEQLTFVKGVTGISGFGLMLGISVLGDAHIIAGKCMEKGVLVLTAKDKIRLLPPLNIPQQELESAVEIIKEAISE